MGDDTRIYSLTIIRAKPEYLIHMLHMLPIGQKIYEKHGANQLGVWTTETGVMNKIVRLVEWPTFETRMAAMSKRFEDPEMNEYFEKCRKYYTQVDTFICRSDSHIPVGRFSRIRPMWIKRFIPKRSEAFTTQKIREMAKVIAKVLGDECTLNALLHPIFYSDRCLFTLSQLNDGYDWENCINNMAGFMRNPENCEQLEECHRSFNMCRSVICNPIQFEELPLPTEPEEEKEEKEGKEEFEEILAGEIQKSTEPTDQV